MNGPAGQSTASPSQGHEDNDSGLGISPEGEVLSCQEAWSGAMVRVGHESGGSRTPLEQRSRARKMTFVFGGGSAGWNLGCSGGLRQAERKETWQGGSSLSHMRPCAGREKSEKLGYLALPAPSMRGTCPWWSRIHCLSESWSPCEQSLSWTCMHLLVTLLGSLPPPRPFPQAAQ